MSELGNPTEKRVYLDVCALSRPFDEQTQLRIHLETGAVELILAHIESGKYVLVVTTVHDLEIEAIPDVEERKQLLLLLQQFGTRLEFDMVSALKQAESWVSKGMGVADAAHLAFAEQAQAAFITVDDRVLRLCRRYAPAVWVGSPPAYCEKEDLR